MKISGELNGDRSPELLAELIRVNYAKLFRLALSIVHLQEDAEDVMQDASLQMFRKFSRFREDSNFYTWAHRIVYNFAVSVLRKRKRTREVVWNDEETKNIGFGRIEELREKMEREYLAWKILSILPQSLREILELKYLEELTEIEVAEGLCIKLSALRSRAYRALLYARNSEVARGATKEIKKRVSIRNRTAFIWKEIAEIQGEDEKVKIAREILLSCASALCPVPIVIHANGGHTIIKASHISAYLMRETLGMEFDDIGLVLGKKDKAVALYAYRKVYKYMQHDRRLRMIVWNIKQKLAKIFVEKNGELVI